jgi:hypothetical protein
MKGNKHKVDKKFTLCVETLKFPTLQILWHYGIVCLKLNVYHPNRNIFKNVEYGNIYMNEKPFQKLKVILKQEYHFFS